MVERDHGVIWALWVMILVGIYALFPLEEVSSLKRKTSVQRSEFRFHLWNLNEDLKDKTPLQLKK